MVEPGYGWFATADRKLTQRRSPYIRVSKQQIIDAIPFVVRYSRYWLKYIRQKDVLFIDTFRPISWKPYFGVPCGGIGSGAIGRDFRGAFRKFSLRPGLVEHHVDIVPADQFIATVRSGGITVYQQVLCAAPVSNKQLSSWNFDFPPGNLKYHGLYPRSWTHYDLPINERKVSLTCRQISPVIPEDYKNSCLPACVFVWDIKNDCREALDISLTFTFRNGTGDPRWSRKCDCSAQAIDQFPSMKGMSINHKIDDMDCVYSVAAQTNENESITCRTFNPTASGKKLWNDLLSDGQLDENVVDSSKKHKHIAIAVCVQVKVSAKSTGQVRFSLTWDMPIIRFPGKRRDYKRRYTRWFGSDLKSSALLCKYAIENVEKWETAIESWQNPILQNEQLPAWYKSAIFNELYFLTDGGTVWVEYEDSWRTDEPHLSDYAIDLMKEWGRFAYLESWEYRMLNTYDVHFYASFALAMVYPRIEQCMQIEFTCQLFSSDKSLRKYFYNGDIAPTKTLHRLPHDLGNPGIGLLTSDAEDPWLYTNAYMMHNTGEWRDLNLKFILMSYRDMIHICPHDQRFKDHVWPAIKIVMEESLSKWDEDGDFLIENSGTCDQTYDAWKMKGASAYCGGLWLACVRVAQEFAHLMGEEKLSTYYSDMLQTARDSYDKKLWNGEYFKFDEFSARSDSIMADQLCGYWFLDLTNPDISNDILKPGRVEKCVDTIYRKNVLGFAGGKMGAVNGMQPSGKKDRICIQAEEVWTGVTYALASLLLRKGRSNEGFVTAGGLHTTCFDKLGLQYQTPEAIYEKTSYRAVGYMRPLSIWAMQWTLKKHYQFPNLPKNIFPVIEQV